jgi:hypothetical protein
MLNEHLTLYKSTIDTKDFRICAPMISTVGLFAVGAAAINVNVLTDLSLLLWCLHFAFVFMAVVPMVNLTLFKLR